MRLDKWLKISRLVKRRTLAHDAAEAGRVSIGGKPAKPASDVRVGDLLEIDLGGRITRVRVLATPEHASAQGAKELYEVLSQQEKAAPEKA
ncbi:MAG: RNA-binding S4 domain-containing protein [Thermaerobacter sp.]|nr:RNA-binding S4 domain-containing protein [Thermaerobacter sp.]